MRRGTVLGVFRQLDAPVFGFDVSVQKARTAAFFSSANAGTLLRGAGFSIVRGSRRGRWSEVWMARWRSRIARSGFCTGRFFLTELTTPPPGHSARHLIEWSPFNVGLQLDLIKTNLLAAIGGAVVPCSTIPNVPNGLQIFPGSVPLYKNGVLVGAIGISGDGVDQDDLIGAAGGNGFSPAPAIRSDQIFVRGVRLPFLKFPRSPNL